MCVMFGIKYIKNMKYKKNGKIYLILEIKNWITFTTKWRNKFINLCHWCIFLAKKLKLILFHICHISLLMLTLNHWTWKWNKYFMPLKSCFYLIKKQFFFVQTNEKMFWLKVFPGKFPHYQKTKLIKTIFLFSLSLQHGKPKTLSYFLCIK